MLRDWRRPTSTVSGSLKILKVLETSENETTTLSEPSGYRKERGKVTDLSVSAKINK